MKVLHCIGPLLGGGAETQLRIFNNNSHGIENVILALSNTGIESFTMPENITILKSKTIVKRWLEVYRLTKSAQPDIIHIWLPALLPYFLIPSLFFKKGIVVCGVRSVYKMDSFKRAIHYLLYNFSKFYISNVHPDDMRGAFKSLRKRCFYYVPNAIRYSKEEDTGLISISKRLLFVGRLIEDKNILLLIKALGKLKDDNIKFELDICGDGPLKARILREIHAYGLRDQIKLYGFQTEIAPFYRRASAIVLPSWREGMPNVVFEAASFGKVLILSDIPQHFRWFQDGRNAFLFQSNNLEALCKAIVRFSNMSECTKNEFNKINQKVIESLSIENYCRKLTSVYEKILSNEVYK